MMEYPYSSSPRRVLPLTTYHLSNNTLIEIRVKLQLIHDLAE